MLIDAGPLAASEAQTAGDPTVLRSRYAAIDFDVLPGPADRRMLREPAVSLQLFPDVTIFGVFDRYDPNPDGVTWVGHVDGVPASFITLAYSSGFMAGSIVTPDALFQIRPAPGTSLHIVSEIDQSKFLREAEPIEVRISDADRAAAANAPMADTADVIDVLVLYTALAAVHAGGQGGIANLINLGISETNTSYVNSGVTHRIRLARAIQVPYTEVNSFSANLNNLRNGAGALSGVAALRDTYRADLVAMLVHPSSPDACGIAFLMTAVSSAFGTSAFSVTDSSCVSPTSRSRTSSVTTWARATTGSWTTGRRRSLLRTGTSTRRPASAGEQSWRIPTCATCSDSTARDCSSGRIPRRSTWGSAAAAPIATGCSTVFSGRADGHRGRHQHRVSAGEHRGNQLRCGR